MYLGRQVSRTLTSCACVFSAACAPKAASNITDEMFWPGDRETAIGALGLLRFAVLRDAAKAEDYPGLDQTPPDKNSPFIQLLDAEWLALAVEEARAYEACVTRH